MKEERNCRPPIIRPGWLIKATHRGEWFRGKFYKYGSRFCIVKLIWANNNHPQEPGRVICGIWDDTKEGALSYAENPHWIDDWYYNSSFSNITSATVTGDYRDTFKVLSKKPIGVGNYCLKCGRKTRKHELFSTVVYMCEKCGEIDPFNFKLENEKELLDAVEQMDRKGKLPIRGPFADPLPEGKEFCFD